MFGHVYNPFLTCTYAVLLHPSSFTQALVMTHVPKMMSQTSLFFIRCLFLPSPMVQSMVQRTASLAHHPKDRGRSLLLVWILLVPSLLGVTRTQGREIDCDIRNLLRWPPLRSPSEWLPDVMPCEKDSFPTTHRACWFCCSKETWWPPILTYRCGSNQRV